MRRGEREMERGRERERRASDEEREKGELPVERLEGKWQDVTERGIDIRVGM